MYHEYPYTTYFHDIDKLCRACHDAGYKLLVDANALKLLNKNDEVVSTVVIHYAETALADVDGKAIKSYIFNASTDTDELVFTTGNGTTFSLTIPFATKAEKDKLNKDLTDYVYEVQASGDKIQIVKGDSTVTEITVPFATKALTDTNGKDIKTYAATMAVDGDYIVLKDSAGSELARLTAPYAIKAFSDDDGDTFTTTYAATLEAGTTTVILKAKDGNTLSTITVPYATKALTDTNGNAFLHDYAETIVVDGDGKRIGLEAHDGTRLATITVPFATLATDATNAVETISVVGDQIVFTTYGGQAYSITAPYAVKAQKDDAGNTIKSTYVASVTNDTSTGKLTFKDALGQTIVELTPTVSKATYDSYNNLIADYVKTILASASSDYVTVTHGDGDTEQITINYSTHAWKDTNENVIKNTYIKRLACVEDVQDHHYKLVAYNGDTPEAELFRIELIAYEAQRAIGDKNGVDITTYVHDVTIDSSTKEVVVKDGTNTEKARFKAGGTQLKYDDQGTLTDIDEAELGTGLEYDDVTGMINCTASGGLKQAHFEIGTNDFASLAFDDTPTDGDLIHVTGLTSFASYKNRICYVGSTDSDKVLKNGFYGAGGSSDYIYALDTRFDYIIKCHDAANNKYSLIAGGPLNKEIELYDGGKYDTMDSNIHYGFLLGQPVYKYFDAYNTSGKAVVFTGSAGTGDYYQYATQYMYYMKDMAVIIEEVQFYGSESGAPTHIKVPDGCLRPRKLIALGPTNEWGFASGATAFFMADLASTDSSNEMLYKLVPDMYAFNTFISNAIANSSLVHLLVVCDVIYNNQVSI